MKIRPKNKKLFDISWRDLKNYFSSHRYLETRKITSYLDLPERIFEEADPVFILSTGRCGTKLLGDLFVLAKAGLVFHEPSPKLLLGSRIAYEMGKENLEAKKLAFLTARYDLMKHVFLREKRYFETNNRTTFFADAVYNLFEKSKFVHLVRHPGDFVRSGIRRNYYSNSETDDTRLVPLKSDPIFDQWKAFSLIKKIGWLWNETNRFIEDLKESFDHERIITICSEDLFEDPQIFRDICTYLNLSIPGETKILSKLSRPVNKQKRGSFPRYDQWTDFQKKDLNEIITLAARYNYNL